MQNTVTLGQATYTVSRRFSGSRRTREQLLRELLEKKLAQGRPIAPGGGHAV